MRISPSFTLERKRIEDAFLHASYEVKAPKWQGVDVSAKPEMAMREIFTWDFAIPYRGKENLAHWANDTKANLPWADVHFAERIGGEPLNPGESWKTWPWGHSAAKFRVHGHHSDCAVHNPPALPAGPCNCGNGQFSHTYMERIWPKFANRGQYDPSVGPEFKGGAIQGIRFQYGDLDDLIEHLANDPMSRQAYLPIWFPEDGTCEGRRPCTLGYHFIMRNGYFHCTYYIRSCDFTRHWGDDCYLAIRLHLYILDQLRKRDSHWKEIMPGFLRFDCVSLHIFVNDFYQLKAAQK